MKRNRQFCAAVLGALLVCSSSGVLAQTAPVADSAPGAENAPQQLQFNFNYQVRRDGKTGKISTEFETGFGRIFSGEDAVPFEKTVSSRGGLPLVESVWFVNGKGAKVGSLETVFDGKGALKTQNLRVGNAAPRALNWFKTKALASPQITVPGAILSVRYARGGARLSRRVLAVKTALGTQNLETTYDQNGRRVSDKGGGSGEPMNVSYRYGAFGLSGFTAQGDADDAKREAKIAYNASGAIEFLSVLQNGQLVNKIGLRFEGEKAVQTRSESYENGILSSAITQDVATNEEISDRYEKGQLVRRTIFHMATKKPLALESWSAGKRESRVEFDQNGAPIREIFYNADGSVKEVRE